MIRLGVGFTFLCICSLGCDDTPPGGAANLLSPRAPVVVSTEAGSQLFVIDEGHSMLRAVDLSTGTYQPGPNPYFPRGVLLDGHVIDLKVDGERLVALSSTGALFEVPLRQGPAFRRSKPLPPLVANWRAVAIVGQGDQFGRIDEDCALAVEGETSVQTGGFGVCLGRVGSYVYGVSAGATMWIATVDLVEGLGERILLPSVMERLVADSNGGLWGLSPDGLVVTSMDAEGRLIRRFGLVAPGNDLVVTEADEADFVIAVAGQDGYIWYYDTDGAVRGTATVRAPEDVIAVGLSGYSSDLTVERQDSAELSPGDILAMHQPELFRGTVDVSPEGDLIGITDNSLVLRPGHRVIYYRDGSVWCYDAIQENARIRGGCGTGSQELAIQSLQWELFAGVPAWDPSMDLTELNYLGPLEAGDFIDYQGFRIRRAEESTATGGIHMHIRLGVGARTALELGGWLSGVTRAQVKTFYNPEQAEEWLFATGSGSETIFQFPPLATQGFEVKTYR